jgi:ADP-ribosylglycohydrolase
MTSVSRSATASTGRAPLPINDLSARIRACWLGKNIGGSLGGPHEGKTGPLGLTFYDPVPTQVLPNDDLDLQVVWLHFLLQGGHRVVTTDLLADAWARHVRFPFDEYGVTHRNAALGLRSLARGATDNIFAECMGGAIRSEVWACVAAGEPARAAGLAWADASVDHCGDGVYAEMFHAALQAAAFVESDREVLLDTALEFVPASSRLGAALRDTRRRCRAGESWERLREDVVRRHGTGNFTDVVCNLCFELIGWYAGGGDFGRSVCLAVNCGYDTDCTGATLGALLGILDPNSIPERWVRPIGEEVVLSREIVDVPTPRDLATLTQWTLELREQLAGFSAPIGNVLPQLPPRGATGALPVTGVAARGDDTVFGAATAPASRSWLEFERSGHWWRLSPYEFDGPARLLRLSFTVAGPAPVKLMAHYAPGLAAWVDGVRCLAYGPGDLAKDPFVAASFHRAGPAACVFPGAGLAPGTHELVLALRRPSGSDPADLVFGLADAATHLWHAHAFSNL